MTVTQYGTTSEEKWTTIESRLVEAAQRLPRTEDEDGFWPAVKRLNDAKMHDVQPVYLTRASVDIEPSDDILLDTGDLGYRITAAETKLGVVLVIEVMHENNGDLGNPPVPGSNGEPLPFVTTKAWAVMPDAESNPLEFLAEIRSAYNNLCAYSDRTEIQTPEQQAARRDAQENQELLDSGLEFLADSKEVSATDGDEESMHSSTF